MTQRNGAGPVSTREEVVSRLRAESPRLRAEYGVRSLDLVGSFARGEAGPTSDVDVLAEFDVVPTLFTLVKLTDDLQALLGRRVDVLMPGGLRARVLNDIQADAIRV